MIVMGIDPGATTGWCLYSAIVRRVLASGLFPGADATPDFRAQSTYATVFVIERPMGYGPTYPQVVDAAWYAGELRALTNATPITRRDIKTILTNATQRDVIVRDDASAWAALKLLHTENADVPLPDKKGGALYGVKAHERAALAVAVAFALKQAKAAEAV